MTSKLSGFTQNLFGIILGHRYVYVNTMHGNVYVDKG